MLLIVLRAVYSIDSYRLASFTSPFSSQHQPGVERAEKLLLFFFQNRLGGSGKCLSNDHELGLLRRFLPPSFSTRRLVNKN